MLKYKYELFTKKNSKSNDKPNEDAAVFNESHSIGLVLDGVSRDKEDGIYPNPSPAQIATQLFAEACLHEAEQKRTSGIEKIQLMIRRGNDELREYNNRLNHRFPAGTVGIVFAIECDCFQYGYIGDCYATVIRDGMMRTFTECQTEMVVKHKGEFSSDNIRFDICNHISHPCGYGVWDGNQAAMDFVKYGTIGLLEGDVILIYTDGFKAAADSHKIDDLKHLPLNKIDEVNPDFGMDDRTCIRVSFEKV